ncbi:Putative multidrug export ATP-binding/permease protein [Pontiella desulfatans]|uniref:Multidrug export ATP-binding/permease protein n=1 Tax=Pontiella desulfatans TaxID=2750659 RepID=A0A6C2U2S2_PONDE|nr:ABC transporter ATP-binding protein [Pontiella desulfatans]VGO14298.1 Putative multidrug export ATP-binding/permease protein [Pontiella desulfatans]
MMGRSSRRNPISKPSTRLSQYLIPHRKEIVATFVCAMVTVGANLAMPVVIRWVIDGLIEGTLTRELLWQYLGAFLLIGVVSLAFSRWLRQIPQKMSHKIEYELRRDVFAHLTTLDQEYYRSERTGDLMTRMSSDINIIRDSIGQGFLQGTRTITVIVFASIVMGIADAQLAGIVIALFTPMVLIFFLILRVMRRHQQALQEHVSEVSNYSQESFSGIRCLKGFALERRRNAAFADLNSGLINKTMRMQGTRQSLFPFMAFWFNLGTILIFIVGGKKIMQGELTVGTLTQFIQYLLYMQWPLLALSWVLSLTQRGKVSWIRVREILERESSLEHRTSNVELRPSNGDIRFEGVELEIEDRTFLSGINLDIAEGTTLGITGPTGSGKTLLVSLVARLMDPTQGAVKIGGSDIRDISLNALRGVIGFAAQEPVLFSRTLEHNIGFGVVDADMETIGWAADIAHLHHDVLDFPDQYQTMLGERGVTLSGGQRQRTSISRAIARRPRILVLDDVLSAVDTQTEAAIMEKLQPVMAERTTLFVSHRVSTLRYADEVIVIEDGRITQRGTHEELIRQPGYYSELNTMQQLEERLEGDS